MRTVGGREFDLSLHNEWYIGSISTLTQQLSCSYQCFLVIATRHSFKGQDTSSFPLTVFSISFSHLPRFRNSCDRYRHCVKVKKHTALFTVMLTKVGKRGMVYNENTRQEGVISRQKYINQTKQKRQAKGKV